MSIERVSFATAMHERRGNAYRCYLVGLLMVILAFNFVDRIALGVVLEDIKADLRLSDTQLGFMGGIAFAFFYAVMGIPIARWADRGNRITIITLTTAFWSLAVALCGAATSFVQLMSIRIGVAVGEAGCVPPAHSLIADLAHRAAASHGDLHAGGALGAHDRLLCLRVAQ
jgi:MFS family permease